MDRIRWFHVLLVYCFLFTACGPATVSADKPAYNPSAELQVKILKGENKGAFEGFRYTFDGNVYQTITAKTLGKEVVFFNKYVFTKKNVVVLLKEGSDQKFVIYDTTGKNVFEVVIPMELDGISKIISLDVTNDGQVTINFDTGYGSFVYTNKNGFVTTVSK